MTSHPVDAEGVALSFYNRPLEQYRADYCLDLHCLFLEKYFVRRALHYAGFQGELNRLLFLVFAGECYQAQTSLPSLFYDYFAGLLERFLLT